jgi:hypothetical protein
MMSEEEKEMASSVTEEVVAREHERESLLKEQALKLEETDLKREATGLPLLGRYIFRASIVFGVAIVFGAIATNITAILDRIDWHYLLLAAVFTALFLLPDAPEESD